jgi:hypothetical protein
LWAPLWVLLAVVILLVVATPSNLISVSVPAWLPIPILSLLAASHIYRSLPANRATLKAKEEWKRDHAHLGCTLELTENGFKYGDGSKTYNAAWGEVSSVFQSEHLIIFCYDEDEYALFIPKRAFTSEQLQEFLEIAYQETVVERGGEVADVVVGAR